MIIITGAAGFIGSALAWRLNRMGRNRLLLVDQLGTSQKWRNLVPLRYHDYMEKADFLDAIQSGRLDGRDVQAIIHMGACSSTTEQDSSYLAKNNFEYSKVLADWCLDRAAPVRLIYASSAATYGDGENGYGDDHSLLRDLRPLNMYGYSKHMFDLWNQERSRLDQVVALKFFNVYGPNEYHKGHMKSMVVKAYEQIKATGMVQLFRSHHPDYRDGEQMRDFVYVKDAVEMALFFLDPSIAGGTYNVGTGAARTWVDMMNALFRSLGKEPSIEFVPMPEVLREKYQYYTKADPAKILGAGFSKSVRSLEEGVADYVAYLEAGQRPLGWNPSLE
ncbi:MAG: ADP-glyceromanno-heptose 6-epimerase [Fibrobacterota bacterium]|nr:ADP-glyceromanno-heptose 6-epimerase [Fibrobacterota bacterium]